MKKKNILLVNDTSLICHHGCNLLMNTIYDFFEKNKLLIKKKIYYEENYLNYVSSINNYDLILINGEGTIHGKINSDTNKVREIIEFIKIVKKKYKTPIVIFNSTISSLKKEQLQIINLVDKIYVREKYSYDYLKKEKIKSEILPDFLTLLKIKNSNKKNQTIIVTDSSIQKTSKKLLRFSTLKNHIYIPILYNNYLRYMRFFTFKFALKFKLFLFINLYLFLKNKYLNFFLKKISNSKFIITGRFHGIFICLALMKPFYTFQSDTYKINGLINLIGLKKRMLSINEINTLKFREFDKYEVLKIKKFKKKSKIKFDRFVKKLHQLRII